MFPEVENVAAAVADSEVAVTLQSLFVGLLGEIPPELYGLIYVFFLMFLFYVVDCFFLFLKTVFEVHRWRK